MHPATTSPPAVTRQPPGIELVSVDWQRIQLVVRFRPVGGASISATRLALRRARSSERMPATWSATDGGQIVARFNVLQGPDQVPLEPGSWVLEAGRDGNGTASASSRPLLVVGDVAPAAAETNGRSFVFRRGEYRAQPRVAVDGSFRVDVELVPAEPEPLPAPARRALAAVTRHVGRAAIFRALLGLVRVVARRNGRRILFASDSRASLGGNLAVVHERMIQRGLDRTYEIRTLFKPSVRVRRSLVERARLVWRVARADVIVIDDYHPVMYRLDARDTRIVQLWHAVGAFKTVGYSRAGKPGAPDPWSGVHKNYTRAIVSSAHDVPFYAEAFGIPEPRVIPTGIPRVDRFFDPAYRDAATARTLAAFPEARGRRTILFAPTFRGNGAKSAYYDLDRIDVAALHALCVEKDAVCIVRMHPFVTDRLAVPDGCRDRILDGSSTALDVNEILPAVDLLITDYSSVVFEYSTLGRPMLFYAYDLDAYVDSRDFYVRYEDFVPGRIVRTFDALLAAIRDEDFEAEKVGPFAARHFDHRDDHSTDRVVDLIVCR